MAVHEADAEKASDTDSGTRTGTATPSDPDAEAALATLQAGLDSPIQSFGTVQLGKKNTTGILSAPKGALNAEGVEVCDDADDRPEVPVVYHAQLGLLIYDIRGEFSQRTRGKT